MQKWIYLVILVISTQAVAKLLPIDNPIVIQRADPQLVRHADSGCYTFIATSPKFDQIELRRACQFNNLKIAEPKVIWRKNNSGPLSANIWAPELHFVDDAWYIYFAAAEQDKPFYIRMYAIKNSHKDPMQGQWQQPVRVFSHLDSFSLDATVFSHNNKHYMVWAQQDEARSYNSALWLAEMTSPTELDLKTVTLITKPELDWEVQGYKVNEGAAVLKRNGKIFITYSASATDHRYAMGLLWADDSADLTETKNWHKSPVPVFTTDATLSRFGPGHNSFVKDTDGVTDLMIYHSRDYLELRGNPLTDPNRHARARRIGWDDKGFPVFNSEQVD